MDKWIYAAIFLDENSKNELRNYFSDVILNGGKLICDHITIVFNEGNLISNSIFNTISNRIGEEFDIKVKRIGKSEKAIALEVDTVPEISTFNKIKHITIATFLDGKPVDSNNIINWEDSGTKFDGMKLKGKLGIFKKENGKTKIYFS